MYVETLFEEVEAILIKSVGQNSLICSDTSEILVLPGFAFVDGPSNVKFLELIMLLTVSRLFLK